MAILFSVHSCQRRSSLNRNRIKINGKQNHTCILLVNVEQIFLRRLVYNVWLLVYFVQNSATIACEG